MSKTIESSPAQVQIPDRLYFRIGDVAELVGVKAYVLRYWESEFPMISPQKSSSGHRVYRKLDVETVLLIKHLLYVERYSIEGARKRIRELRSDGELGLFKKQKILPSPDSKPSETHAVSSQATKDRINKMRLLAKELKSLAKTPISELF